MKVEHWCILLCTCSTSLIDCPFLLSPDVITLSKGNTVRAWYLPDGALLWESRIEATPGFNLGLISLPVRTLQCSLSYSRFGMLGGSEVSSCKSIKIMHRCIMQLVHYCDGSVVKDAIGATLLRAGRCLCCCSLFIIPYLYDL